MDDELIAEQRRITRIALETLGSDDFALAGSGAIREHGLIDGPTQDVGPVLARDEAVGNKIATLFSRGRSATTSTRMLSAPAPYTATRTSTAWPNDPMVDSPPTTQVDGKGYEDHHRGASRLDRGMER